MRHVLFALGLFAILAAVPAAAQEPAKTPAQEPAKAPAIAPEANQRLQEMCDFLKKQQAFSFKADVSQEQVYPSGQTIQYTRQVEVVLKRPDKLYARTTGDEIDRTFVYDGKTVTLYDKDKGTYATVDVPNTIDAALEFLSETYGVSAPLSDLLYSDPCQAMTGNISSGSFAGTSLVGGQTCCHLAFMQSDADWQVWINSGAQPTPRKLVINDKSLVGWPQYEAVLSDWTFSPQISDTTFTIDIPKEARKVDFLPLANAQGGQQ